jgi:hypothetical protein
MPLNYPIKIVLKPTMWAPLVLSWIKYSHISNTIVISTRNPSHCSYKPHIVGKSSCLSNYMGHCQKPPTTRGRDVNVAEILRTLVPALGVQYTYIYIHDTHMYLIRFTYDIHIYIYTYYIYILYIYTHTYMINIYIRCVTLYLYIIYICFYIYDIFMNWYVIHICTSKHLPLAWHHRDHRVHGESVSQEVIVFNSKFSSLLWKPCAI